MDPEATLAELRNLTELVKDDSLLCEEIYARFAALDEWLKSGGLLPREWAANRAGLSPSQYEPRREFCGACDDVCQRNHA